MKHALVIGASRGLGLGLSAELAGRGWHVTATARNPAASYGLHDAMMRSPDRLRVETLDIDDPGGLEALVARLSAENFDLLFVNAGVMGPEHQSVDRVTPAELGALMLTNAVAPIRLARRFIPRIKPGGIIAFMTSRMGSVSDNRSGGMDLYRASKAALNSLTRGFVVNDIGNRAITVLSMHPGWVRTDMGGAAAPLDVATSARHGRCDRETGRQGPASLSRLSGPGNRVVADTKYIAG